MSDKYENIYRAHKGAALNVRGGITGFAHLTGKSPVIVNNKLNRNGHKLNIEDSQDLQDHDPEHLILTAMAARQGLMLVDIPKFNGEITTDNLMAAANRLSAYMGGVSKAVIEAVDPYGNGGDSVTRAESVLVMAACDELLQQLLQIKIDLNSR